MSRTTVLGIKPGIGYFALDELRNSWGSAPHVWNALARKYLGVDGFMHLELYGLTNKLWELVGRKDIPIYTRAVLLFTFDAVYVAKNDYWRMARNIDYYLQDHPVPSDQVNHWPTIADIFREDPDVGGIGLWCTSVSGNPFETGGWDEEREERRPIDWTKVYDLYKELKVHE